MKITRLGKTGLEVSQLCLGCMSFGKPNDRRPWALEEDEARPLFRRAWEAGINFFDTANVYQAGYERGDHRQDPEGTGDARGDRARHQGLWPHAAPGRTAPGSAARRSWPRSTTA